ncbi:MAG: FHA domain-containing protein [Vicinamibacterales bacterium]
MRFGRSAAIRLRFLNGPERGRVVVRRGQACRIGRSRDNDLTLPDREGALAGAHHAVARYERGQWWLHDLGSMNGTFVNGVRVTRAPFGPGDHLVFGDVECAVVRSGAVTAVAGAAVLAAALVGAYVLGSASRATFEAPAAAVAASTYLIALEGPAGRRAIGTAFVVQPTLLATNAHVADTLQALRAADPGAHGVALRSDSDERVQIVEIFLHPRWRRGSLADDAALLRLERPAGGAALTLADSATVAGLPRGVALGTFGFPTAGTDVNRPRGRLSIDVLGEVRDGRYLGTGLNIAPGTSGSPIFLASGVIVGLVTGGDFVVAPDNSRRPSGSGVNWGISVDGVHDLLRTARDPRH